MSWLSDFDKLNQTTKSISLSIGVSIPFWLVAIYLFKKPLYEQGDYIIIGAFCLCFSVVNYTLKILISSLGAAIDDDKDDDPIIFAIVGVISILNLSFWITIAYYFEWSFFTLLCYIFAVPTVTFVVLFVMVIIKDEKKENASKSEPPKELNQPKAETEDSGHHL